MAVRYPRFWIVSLASTLLFITGGCADTSSGDRQTPLTSSVTVTPAPATGSPTETTTGPGTSTTTNSEAAPTSVGAATAPGVRAGGLCGASFARENGETWSDALHREESLLGPFGAVRLFHSGLPAAWPGPLDVGSGRSLVVSFKGNARDYADGVHDASLRRWFASAPRDRDIYWSYYHEPEDNIRDGEFTATEYRTAWQRLAALADEAGNPRLHATMILMEWTLSPSSGRDWRDYFPGAGVLDVLAWDVYNYDSEAAKGEYVEPSKLLDRMGVANASVGLPFGVAELGGHLAAGDTGTKRAAWIRTMVGELRMRGALWILWFDLPWATGDHRIRDPSGLAAWRESCA